MLFYMYIAPRQGQTTLWGQMLMSTESPYHFAHLLQVLKQSLHVFFMFFHVYSPRQGQTNPWGQNFNNNRKALSFWAFVASFELWFYTHFLMFFHVYLALGQGQTMPWCQNFDPNRQALLLWPFVANLKKSLSTLILYIFLNYFIHVYQHRLDCRSTQAECGCPEKIWQAKEIMGWSAWEWQKEARYGFCWPSKSFWVERTPLRKTCQTAQPSVEENRALKAPGQEQTNPWCQNFDVNRKALSFWPFVASFKKISLKSDFK